MKMNENITFEDQVLSWWVGLNRDNASRSKMRRESTMMGIQMNESFFDLYRMVPWVKDIDALSCVAMVISNIDGDDVDSIATRMGKKTPSSEHSVSELRFRRIIESEGEDAARHVVRVLPMINRYANIKETAKAIMYWDNPNQISKKNWIKDYYLANGKRNEEE